MRPTIPPGQPAGAHVHVVVCADRGFAMPLAVTLTSLDAATTGPLTAHVVHTGFDAPSQRRVLAGAPGLDVRWYEFDRSVLDGVHNTEALTEAALFRLTIGELLPEEVRRVVYLDADVLVQGDVAELFHRDLGGNTVGAVRDAFAPWAAGAHGAQWRPLGLDPRSSYFNSGVLLVDLDRWRATRAGHRCIEILRDVDARWGDQDALNKVFENAWTELPRRWNVQTADLELDSFSWVLATDEIARAVVEPGVVHYTSRRKPWVPGALHPAADPWFAVLDRTAWSGWRPPRPADEQGGLEAAATRAVRQVRRWRSERRNRLPA